MISVVTMVTVVTVRIKVATCVCLICGVECWTVLWLCREIDNRLCMNDIGGNYGNCGHCGKCVDQCCVLYVLGWILAWFVIM